MITRLEAKRGLVPDHPKLTITMIPKSRMLSLGIIDYARCPARWSKTNWTRDTAELAYRTFRSVNQRLSTYLGDRHISNRQLVPMPEV